VDVVPKETLYEQESGNVNSYITNCVKQLDRKSNGHHGALRKNIISLLSPFLVRIFSPVPNLRHVAIHP